MIMLYGFINSPMSSLRSLQIGDIIVVAAGCNEGKAAPELPDPADIPETAILADYFW
jgi:hypothetical protein